MDTQTNSANNGLSRYLSPLGVWGLSFGCAVGWGAFVMPGTTFLPKAGPLGAAIGIGIGAVIMLIIGMNYHFMMNKYPDAGGTLTYTAKTFGYDHGFLSAWFLVLVYMAIIWANATALTLIARHLLGGALQFGFHYTILGYDVYLGEVLLTIAAILLFGFICFRSKRAAVCIQAILALLLIAGVVFSAFAVLGASQGLRTGLRPLFAPEGNRVNQIISIVVLAPWAFAGFESVSQSAEGFKFSPKKTIWIFLAALVTGAAAYILLTLIAAAILPESYQSWTDWLAELDVLGGLKGLPTFFATHKALGGAGLVILGVTVCAAIITGLVGNFIAASRLLYAMAEDGILPKWFGRLNKDHTPQNALLFLMAVSLFIPFVGRTAIGWIVDVNTIGATIAYAYTSAAAFWAAYKDRKRAIVVTGILGCVLSAGFFIYFMALSGGALATESYLILALWSILGFVFFRNVFRRDTEKRFGKSIVVWITLLFLIFFTSLMWVRQSTDNMTRDVVQNISEYYEKHIFQEDPRVLADTEAYLAEQMAMANRLLTRNSIIQMLLIVAALAIMFNVYSLMSRREKQAEVEKAQAEESSRAKTVFLSNMSHDIRTPMNAIIGYTNLARRQDNSPEEVLEYLNKIETSSQHLLALINDVLEMSRIESGKMDLEPVPIDLRRTLGEVRDMFSTQMAEKQISFAVDASQVRNRRVLCDKNRLYRVLLNLLSNSYKFTPIGGDITVTMWQIGTAEDGYGTYELRVRDSGIGMTAEFAAKVFEPFERERTSTVSKIQGTGLGMSITKSIVDLMGGTIDVVTAPGAGTEFIIRIRLKLQEETEEAEAQDTEDLVEVEDDTLPDFSNMRLLLTEDNEINREIATMILEDAGFALEVAENGKEAVEKVSAAEPGYFAAVLMDIQMPVMNGYEAARAIRALDDPGRAGVPIVAMTANAFSEDVKMAEEAGMNAHVAKPIDVEVLMRTLRKVIRN